MLWLILILAFIATILGAFGALFLKRGGTGFTLHPIELIKNYNLIIGLGLYVVASIVFVYALKFGELSMIYPLTSLSYIWVTILSVKWLKEPLTKTKFWGIVLIILGVVLITIR
ncbi:multidrug transporter [Candidatus Woesearchaeota archaeon]|nr:EamA family transporter [Candidatus Woesearchaeota archaeon]RLE42233.1 MAG: multidrug transporter [Candidatus Woesearchaeota archaeon]